MATKTEPAHSVCNIFDLQVLSEGVKSLCRPLAQLSLLTAIPGKHATIVLCAAGFCHPRYTQSSQ
ncbi:hypothetical protein BaRGS_00000475, partial [Batillaria attramentaria]